jgi:hypothetical protein
MHKKRAQIVVQLFINKLQITTTNTHRYFTIFRTIYMCETSSLKDKVRDAPKQKEEGEGEEL